MKHFYVIEVEEHGAWVYEVTREFTANDDLDKGVAYYKSPSAHSVFHGPVGPKFYGKLDTLLVTKDKINAAPEIQPQT